MNFNSTIKNSNYPSVKLHDFKARNFKELARTILPEGSYERIKKPDLNQRSQKPINRNRCPNQRQRETLNENHPLGHML